MGAVNFSIDRELVKTLQAALPLRVFVETGTFEGDSLNSVRDLFDHLYSVELSQVYYQQALSQFSQDSNINLTHGNSPDFLTTMASAFSSQATLFWLDAHWCEAQDTGGKESQCPLLQELAALRPLHQESVILIDDARLFLCTPCAPHEVTHWPSFQDVLDHLRALSSHHQIIILNDVILFFPTSIAPVLSRYAHEKGIDWLHHLNLAKQMQQQTAEAASQEAIAAYFEAHDLDLERSSDILWQQLVEKEAVIQDLARQLKEVKSQTETARGEE